MVRVRRSNWFRWGSAFSLGVLAITLAWAGTAIPAEQGFPPITGQWEGMYRYDDVKRFPVLVPFTMELRVEGNAIRGRITEPRSDFGPNQSTLGSNLIGAYEAESGSFQFRKVYDYDGHAVHYSGALDRPGVILSGTWRIGGYTGTWFATRRN